MILVYIKYSRRLRSGYIGLGLLERIVMAEVTLTLVGAHRDSPIIANAFSQKKRDWGLCFFCIYSILDTVSVYNRDNV
jgi:hypothetical protein